MIAFLIVLLFILCFAILVPWITFWFEEYMDWVVEKTEALHEKRMERKYKNDGEKE